MKKKLIFTLILALSLGSLSACGSNQTSGIDNPAKQVTESESNLQDSEKERQETSDTTAEETETGSTTTVSTLADGNYSTILVNESDQYGMGTVTSISIEGTVITLEASFKYNTLDKSVYDADATYIDNAPCSISVSDDCICYASGGEASETMSVRDFMSYLNQCVNSGLGFEIVIQNGQAVEMSICS